VLTDDQQVDLATTGWTRVPGLVDRAAADAMADRIWTQLGRRGIQREDSSSWPVGGLAKNQGLRHGKVFDAYGPRAAAVVDDLLGVGAWHGLEGWGPALITFPQPGPWTVPGKVWHFDLPGRGDPDLLAATRLFGYATEVGPGGGGTLVVEGSHELVRRMVAASPGHDAGSSRDLRQRLVARHPWFRALCRGGDGDRLRQLMLDGDEIDELTGEPGDLALMLPWTMHNASMNCAAEPRFMVTHSIYRRGTTIFRKPS
jgi:hypothetical protein